MRTNGYVQMMRWRQEKQFTTSSQLKSRVRLTVNNVPTHRTHTQVTTKSDEITITHSESKTVESTLAQVGLLMTNVATTRSWATTSSQGNDTQPENSQPAGDTRHQRPHVRHDHSSNDDGEQERRNTYSNSSLDRSKELFGTRTRLAPEHPSC